MRWLFSLLLITNLSLGGWIYWQSTGAPAVTAPIETGGQGRLRLLSEMSPQERLPIPVDDDQQEPQAPAAPEAITAAAPSDADLEQPAPEVAQLTVCLRITSAAKRPDFESIAKSVEQLDMKQLDSGEETLTRESYWVFIPPYKTASAARDVSAQLAKAKVRDFLVVRSGEYKHGISLGLFSQRERADKRLQQVLALKLAIRRPEIQTRSTSMQSYWMVLQLSGEEGQKSLQTRLEADGYQVMAVACPV